MFIVIASEKDVQESIKDKRLVIPKKEHWLSPSEISSSNENSTGGSRKRKSIANNDELEAKKQALVEKSIKVS